ncbi:hypothetical protein [Demequina zhanjiangensis]|uniref:WD40 repeat domain-containing protein n=1 Tax=Demequina zhanjiangensis TaxID=3051659 RepID=A0ABT8FZI4_9MICO|nr:hypothetical protein [Demequina sp. SYSU T00b26]MDN4472296.1 hypothetical protein [Demequina sp. SYSU T00b26]
MSDELGDELRALFAQEDARTDGAPDEVLAAVLAGAGRRRRGRTMLAVAASTVGVLAIGGASWAVTTVNRGADPVSQPTIHVTVTPSPDASVTASPAEVVDPYEGDLDGILADEYPEAVQTRPTVSESDTEFGIPIVYPEALVMEDWVWDRVGEGWSVATVGLPDYRHAGSVGVYEMPPSVIYLVSPEEVYFEIALLPEPLWNGVRVVSWDEEDETVRLSFDGGGSSGAVYDLRTGEWEEIVFASYGANADSNQFVAADAEGNELWSARSDNGTKLYRWDARSREWSASALVDQAPHVSAEQGGIAASWCAVSEEGDRVILTGTQDGAWTEIVVYSLTEDSLRTVSVPPVSDPWFLRGEWLDGSTAWFTAVGDDDYVIDLESGAVTAVGERPAGVQNHARSTMWSVGYGEPTDGAVTYRECMC